VTWARVDKSCEECGVVFSSRSPRNKWCSHRCAALSRERAKPVRGRPKTEYPADMVAQITETYGRGNTIIETAQILGLTPRVVQRCMDNHQIPRRPLGKRNQTGPANDHWKGDQAGYEALHLRVITAYGRPQRCDKCGTKDPGKYEWANLTGHYEDIDDYARMCVPCHRRFDGQRRAQTGAPTCPPELARQR
jgi:hypothetical protein